MTHPALIKEVQACRLCADRFAATETRHTPRPVAWFKPSARLLIVGQAPGLRVHESGIPFDDRSGDRLRDWLGVTRDIFYEQARVAILPMAFCFPGYDAKGSDLPPPKICAETWRNRAMATLPNVGLTLMIGSYAQSWHLNLKSNAKMTETVMNWRDHMPHMLPLPHPSWRNTGWLKKNPWFDAELLPALRARVAEVLA